MNRDAAMNGSSTNADQQRSMGHPEDNYGECVSLGGAHGHIVERKRMKRTHLQGTENRVCHQQTMQLKDQNLKNRKVLDYPRPWKANMKARPVTAQADGPLPTKKTVGDYPRPWLDNPVVHPALSCPPVKHTIKIPEQAERRAQVRAAVGTLRCSYFVIAYNMTICMSSAAPVGFGDASPTNVFCELLECILRALSRFCSVPHAISSL
jgi:hypothetical protein